MSGWLKWLAERADGRERRVASTFSLEMMILIGWIIVFSYYAMQPLTDPDTPWHLATGRFILQHGAVPTRDPFSWSMHGQPWVTQEWLFEVVLAWLVHQFQFFGAWLLYAGIHALTVVVLYRLGSRASGGNRVLAAVFAVIGTLAGLDFWTLRPQIYSYFMFAVFLWILQRAREGRFGTIWLAPPLMLVWANTHGSMTIGIFSLVLEVLISFLPSFGRFRKVELPRGARVRLLAAAVLGTGFGFLNPNGVKVFTYALLSTNKLMVDHIMEWHSPDFHISYFKYGVLPLLLFIFLILLGRRNIQLPWRETLFFGGCFAMTLIYQRFTPYLAIAAVPLLVSVLPELGLSLLRPRRWMVLLHGAIIVALIGGLFTQMPRLGGSMDHHFSKTAYPVDAVTYLQRHPVGPRLLNAYDWGGYLIYRGVPTFVDGRTDIFLNQSVFNDYLALQNVWWNTPDLLRNYHFDAALFPSGYSIVTYLESQPDWKVVYSDSQAVILVHTKGAMS